MMIKQAKLRRLNDGFTLVELLVVVAIIGILAALLAPSMVGSKDGAKSELLLKASRDVAQNWMMVSQKCGATTDVNNTPIPASGKSIADVIFGGASNVAPAYQACYNQAKVIPLAEVGQMDGGVWKVQGYDVSFSGGGTVPLQTVYSNVPDELVLLMVQSYSPSLSALSGSDSSSNVVRYSAGASGTRTVSVLRQVG